MDCYGVYSNGNKNMVQIILIVAVALGLPMNYIKPHRGDQKPFWDQNNWQSLCKSCHDKKTLTEDINPTYTY